MFVYILIEYSYYLFTFCKYVLFTKTKVGEFVRVSKTKTNKSKNITSFITICRSNDCRVSAGYEKIACIRLKVCYTFVESFIWHDNDFFPFLLNFDYGDIQIDNCVWLIRLPRDEFESKAKSKCFLIGIFRTRF